MAAPKEDTKTKVFDGTTNDDTALEQFGYTQELKRNFGLLGMVGFSFSIVTSWTALSGVLIIGVVSGGPPVMIYGWLAVCALALTVAYSMAEMCSAYPVAGGQYSWVAILAPPRWARGFSYVCGWFMLIGILAMGATNNLVAANFVLGIAQLNNPGFAIERWHAVLISYLIAFVATASNIVVPSGLNKISKFILAWNITAFIVCFTTILGTAKEKQPASFVFETFQNQTGFNAPYAAIVGLTQAMFGMCCYDAPAHMVEEISQPRKRAPQAIVMSVYIGAVTGFIFLISLCFCMGDIEETAGTATGVPVIEIFHHATGSVGGASTLASLIAVIAIVCANSLMAEGSRAVYAFARDHGLPFSRIFSRVSPRKQVPVNAILLTCLVQVAFDSIYFGTSTGFNTVVLMATEGFYLSYAMPLLSRILAYMTGGNYQLDGPYSLGRYGLLMNVTGFVFLVFCCTVSNFPGVSPVDSENMNYTSAAIGVVMMISAVTWFTTGKEKFTGPQVGHVVQ
ncbi:GABA permease [Periconia macrospinosa]|uniref:GABA permease n=1 Tax=Periconia macrospinosa TaxID=97972 RepID=A0A2V1D9R9_9PLEO|nr:GABA permease [Periconia macrospinosa]